MDVVYVQAEISSHREASEACKVPFSLSSLASANARLCVADHFIILLNLCVAKTFKLLCILGSYSHIDSSGTSVLDYKL